MLAARCFCIEMSEAPRFPPISAFSCEKLGKMDTERYEAASTKRLSTAKTFRASASIVADNYRTDYTFIDLDGGSMFKGESIKRFSLEKRQYLLSSHIIAAPRLTLTRKLFVRSVALCKKNVKQQKGNARIAR